MEPDQRSEWKTPSQDAEQPDEHGLCWRETHIGLLAFKTNEDGTLTWIQFDSNGNGTQIIFDETGHAFYLDGEKTIPVPLPETKEQSHEQFEPEQHHDLFHKPALGSQETFGRGTTASQIELLADVGTDAVPLGSELKMPGGEHGLSSGGCSRENQAEEKRVPKQMTETETEAMTCTQFPLDFCEPCSPVASSFTDSEAADTDRTKKGGLLFRVPWKW